MCMAYCYGSYIATGCGKGNVTKGCSDDLKHRRTQERVEEDRESGLWESETNMISHETSPPPPTLSMNTPWMSEFGLPVSSLCVTLSLWKAHRMIMCIKVVLGTAIYAQGQLPCPTGSPPWSLIGLFPPTDTD